MVPQLDGTYRNASGGYDAQVDRPTIPVSTGGTSASRTWSAGFYDFNNDGWQDLFASGDLVPGCPKCNIMDANLLMVSNGNGTFSDFTMMSGTAPMMSMTNAMPTAVFADFNNDGFVDILEAGMMGEPQVLVNSGVNMGTENWLEVKLVGQGCQIPTCGYLNKDAVGARVVAIVGDVKQLRTVVNGGNYQGNSSLTLHFGLGSATQIDTLTVYWPDAKNGSNPTVITAVPANQKITITEPQ
jgi:hypothetical protein